MTPHNNGAIRRPLDCTVTSPVMFAMRLAGSPPLSQDHRCKVEWNCPRVQPRECRVAVSGQNFKMRGLWLLTWLHLSRVGSIGVSPLDPSDLALCVELWMKSSIGANIRNDVHSPRRFVLGQKDHMKVLRSRYCSSCNKRPLPVLLATPTYFRQPRGLEWTWTMAG